MSSALSLLAKKQVASRFRWRSLLDTSTWGFKSSKAKPSVHRGRSFWLVANNPILIVFPCSSASEWSRTCLSDQKDTNQHYCPQRPTSQLREASLLRLWRMRRNSLHTHHLSSPATAINTYLFISCLFEQLRMLQRRTAASQKDIGINK